jgi:starvation-inducible DNA-binding protein
MATTASETHLPPLGAHVRDEVGRLLQATLVELVDLALVGKQLHWSIVGQRFRPMHLYIDELVDAWRELGDTVAERAVAVGTWPDGQAQALLRGHAPLERGPVGDHDVIRILVGRVVDASERSRSAAERLAALDLVSQDVMVEVTRALEEQLWMLRSQIPQGA